MNEEQKQSRAKSSQHDRLRNYFLLFVALILIFNCDLLRSEDTKSLRVLPKEPGEASKTFRLAAGFRIELVASEPLIRDPVAIDFDEFGRMYVVEYSEFNEYSFREGVEVSGAVKLLEDTDGDGRFDKSIRFLDKVEFPTAVACYDGGVFVGAAPDLLYCKDTDGDGRADDRKIVLTGFARDSAGGGLLNSFRWGLDNRIHVATSFAGGEVRRPDRLDETPVSIHGHGLILDPSTLAFELTSGGGQHGMGIDDWGRKFLCSNVYPMQRLIYDGRYVARNPYFAPPAAALDINAEGRLAKLHRISPLEPWRIQRSRMVAADRPDDEVSQPGGLFTSSSGITIYRGDSWPDEYRGDLFVGEVANNLVYRAKLKPDGVGTSAHRADRDAEFLASTDIWFRPVQFANAPDGNLYVVDMYRELIEGAAFIPQRVLKELDPSSGIDRGRIYRIVAENTTTPSRKRHLPGDVSLDDLSKMLEHPNGWHRDTAARMIYQRQNRRATNRLAEIASKSSSPIGRVHAMHALAGLRQLDKDIVLRALSDDDPQVRIHAIQLAESIGGDDPQVPAKLYSMTDDVDIRVRYQLAFSLGAYSGSNRNKALAELIQRDGSDQWMRAAVQSSLVQGAGDVFARLSSNDRFRQSKTANIVLQTLAAQIGVQNQKSDIAVLLNSLPSFPDQEMTVRQSTIRAFLSSASKEVRQRLSASDSDKLSRYLTDLLQDARITCVDNDANTKDRVTAIRTLALVDLCELEIEKLFSALLDLRQPQPIQSAAIETLGEFDETIVAALLLKQWSSLSPQLRSQAAETLLSRSGWTLTFLDAIEKGQLARSDLSSSRISMLRGHRDQRIQQLATRLFANSGSTGRQDVVNDYQAALKMKGIAGRGKVVFTKNCSACHKLQGVGKELGADLNGISNKSPEAILVNILDPNREVKPKFLNYVLSTTDGRTHLGMIVEETATSIRLQRHDGTRVTVLRIHIDKLHSTNLSFMPEGIEKQIDPRAMADLLVYLASIH